MGFTGLARWVNAPTTGLELINDKILRNHGGTFRGKWSLFVKSYRSVSNANNDSPGPQMPGDRTMCAVTMNENAFLLLEDPSAPTRAENIMAVPFHEPASQLSGSGQATRGGFTQDTSNSSQVNALPPHYRTTFVTVTPSQSLELLLAQLKARWQSVRQAGGQGRGSSNLGTGGAQLVIEGNVYAIGTDWLVRAGNVVLSGGAVRGLLLEAEYLPLHVMPVHSADGTSELLSNLLTSLLPRTPGARTVAVTIPEGQWEEVLHSGDDTEGDPEASDADIEQEDEEEYMDDLCVFGLPPSRRRKGDWQGVDRDRRAAFLIIGALKSEGLL